MKINGNTLIGETNKSLEDIVKMNGEVIYKNVNGENSVTLSKSIVEAKRIIISLKNSAVNWTNDYIIEEPNGKRVCFTTPSFYFNSTSSFGVTNLYKMVFINNSSITSERFGTLTNTGTSTTNDLLLITKVIAFY